MQLLSLRTTSVAASSPSSVGACETKLAMVAHAISPQHMNTTRRCTGTMPYFASWIGPQIAQLPTSVLQ